MSFIKKNFFGNNFHNLFILLFSFLLVFFKWSISYYLFNNENILNKIIFDISDFYYFPYIINLLELDFSPDYLENFKSNNYLPIPLYSILFHTFFLKFFGFIGFFILEFLCLYLFLIILLNFFDKFEINLNLALISSIFIFILPLLSGYLEVFNIKLNTLYGLYSLRFPRPLITSIYFFWGLYLAIKYYQSTKIDIRDYIYIGISMSLTFVSYYYNFINLFLIFLTIFFIKIYKDKNFLRKNFFGLSLAVITFLIFILPFLVLYHLSEIDYLSMIGLISLNLDTKIELLIYLSQKLLSLRFLIPLSILVLLSAIILKLDIKFIKEKIVFLALLFLSSVISPFFFIIISPSVTEIYHFLNWIVIITVFILFTYSIIILNFLLKKIKKKFFLIIFSLVFLLVFESNHFKNLKNNDVSLRSDFYKLQLLINKNDNELNNFLSFIPRAQVLLMLKNKKKFSTIESSFSSLNFNQLEKSFIYNLKFLGIQNENFIKIIENKKGSWRYNNEFVRYFSWYKYQANSLITYKNTNDFSKDELEYILNSSPTKTQQIIVPKFELNRLITLFKNLDLNKNFEKPDLIILKKESLINKYANIKLDQYCEIEGYERLKVYANISSVLCN